MRKKQSFTPITKNFAKELFELGLNGTQMVVLAVFLTWGKEEVFVNSDIVLQSLPWGKDELRKTLKACVEKGLLELGGKTGNGIQIYIRTPKLNEILSTNEKTIFEDI